MSAPVTCPKCGAVLPADAPGGLCPQCLLAAGLAESSQAAGVPTTDQPPAGRFVPPTPAELAPAFPQLEILELLGSGGMGAVYKARQVHLDRLVALKILPPQLAQDPAFEERFLREARVLARLSHPHIVAVYDFGHTSPHPGPLPQGEGGPQPGPLPGGEGACPPSPSGRGAGGEGMPPQEREGRERIEAGPQISRLYYFLMEYVDGTNLREVIRHGQLAPKEALAIVPQICEALQYAHDQGVVHRDIKPENILLDRQGRVKIADFGLAKIARPSPHPLSQRERGAEGGVREFTLTATGQVMGTPHYMAPEQLRGTHDVDHRADIYSLGVVFYEMLTGELPIGKFAPPSRKVQVDVRLDEVVLRALENEPERRYQKASDVKTDVETISRQAGQGASGSASSDDFGSVEAVCRAVRWPALGLYLTGWAELMLGLIGLVWRLLSVWVGGPLLWLHLIESLVLVFSGVIGVLMIEAGRRMRHLQSYRFVVASSIVSLVPIHCLFLLSVPWGIWALVVLSRSEVILAFSRHVRRKLDSASARLTDVETISRQAVQGASGSRVAASLVSTTMPMVLACAIGMLLGGLSMLSGVVLALYALLTQDLQSGAFWGWMGGAFGCFFGGGGALLGSWNSYRQLEGAGDLMKQPGWTWLDSLITAYTLLGLASITGGIVANYLDSAWVVTYSLLNLGGMMVFQGLLFLVFRGLYRRSARINQASPELKASDVKTDVETISRTGSPQQHSTGHPEGTGGVRAPVPDAVVFRRATREGLILAVLWAVMLLFLEAGYLTKADWYFKKEWPYGFLSSTLTVWAFMGIAFLSWWWYLLGKRPDAPRSWTDFWQFWASPAKGLRKGSWIFFVVAMVAIGLLLPWGIIWPESDAIQSAYATFLIGLLPFYLMGTLRWAYADRFRELWRAGKSPHVGGTARKSYRRVVALVIAVVLVLASAWVGWTLWHMPPQSLSLSPGAESVASVREVSPSEVEKRTPGLEVYRYDVKVPPGHEVEFFSQLRIKKPEPGKHTDLGTAGVLRSDGTFELRLQKGETLNPDLKGKLRWDTRTELGGGSTTSGGWMDDPIAALGPPFGSSRIGLGNKPLRLTAEREEYTVLVVLGWKGPQVPGVPSQYVYNPTALADAIEHGDFPHADMEFYLKVRLRKK